jgi:hypothetical protein
VKVDSNGLVHLCKCFAAYMARSIHKLCTIIYFLERTAHYTKPPHVYLRAL